MSTRFWPVAEPSQAAYEALRIAVLSGAPGGDELAAARFARRGLAGLIAWPHAEPVYVGAVLGASRPAWCGSDDPRDQALADAYGFLLAREAAGDRRVGAVSG
jgi:hypothetical protein